MERIALKAAHGIALHARFAAKATEANPGFKSFQAFKDVRGPAGEGMHWHHIVGQHEGNVAKFGAERIHNDYNLIKLDAAIHQQISDEYSTTLQGLGMTLRDWLRTKSYEEQYAYGLTMLRKHGVIP